MEVAGNITFGAVLFVALALRVGLVWLGHWQDQQGLLPYTDVDYRVYSDAARLVWNNASSSPFERHTYRYTPFLAWILTPNVFVHPLFGKFLFVAGDLVTAWMIYRILLAHKSVKNPQLYTMVFLFNPVVFNMSTRGSADVLACLLVIGSIYFLESNRIILGSILYGIAVHFKIYPIIFAPTLLVFFSTGLKPNLNQVKVSLISGTTFLLLSYLVYAFYGAEGIFETYIYHFVRRDIRHNFSVYFYPMYLSYYASPTELPLWFSRIFAILAFVPQMSLILSSALAFGKSSLPLAFFIQTMCFVALNKVVTAQYFLWYLSLLPLIMPFSGIKWTKGIFLSVLWLLAELHWLAWAGALELSGLATFLGIWIASLIFALVNLYIVHQVACNHNKISSARAA